MSGEKNNDCKWEIVMNGFNLVVVICLSLCIFFLIWYVIEMWRDYKKMSYRDFSEYLSSQGVKFCSGCKKCLNKAKYFFLGSEKHKNDEKDFGYE